MSEQEIRNHLRSALAAVVEAEQNRVSTILNDSKIKIAKGGNGVGLDLICY